MPLSSASPAGNGLPTARMVLAGKTQLHGAGRCSQCEVMGLNPGQGASVKANPGKCHRLADDWAAVRRAKPGEAVEVNPRPGVEGRGGGGGGAGPAAGDRCWQAGPGLAGDLRGWPAVGRGR